MVRPGEVGLGMGKMASRDFLQEVTGFQYPIPGTTSRLEQAWPGGARPGKARCGEVRCG
jgi:hypothetical protein